MAYYNLLPEAAPMLLVLVVVPFEPLAFVDWALSTAKLPGPDDYGLPVLLLKLYFNGARLVKEAFFDTGYNSSLLITPAFLD